MSDLRDHEGATSRACHSWSSTDALLYAVAVGAGASDPARELAFTTENSEGVRQRVLPGFATLFAAGLPEPLQRSAPAGSLLHAGEQLTLRRPLPPSANVRVESEVAAVQDKGTGALVLVRSQIFEAARGLQLATISRSIFMRGAGGFDGPRGPRTVCWQPPGEPHAQVAFELAAGQPLIYRLCGDRDPLHSDPAAARRAGYPLPLVHGLCSYGYACRALLSELCDLDPSRFGSMRARFAAPLLARAERLRVEIWRTPAGARFLARDRDGRIVLGDGEFAYADAELPVPASVAE